MNLATKNSLRGQTKVDRGSHNPVLLFFFSSFFKRPRQPRQAAEEEEVGVSEWYQE